jgi:diguanylate cyclase
MNNKKIYLSLIAIIIFILFLFFNAAIFQSESFKFNRENPKLMNQDWLYVQENEIFDILPKRLDIKAFTPYSISTILNEDFDSKQFILIRTSLQDLTIELDGVIIYDQQLKKDQTLPPYASLWHIIEIPQDSNGSTLMITYHSPYRAMSGIINDIYYGSSVELHRHIISQFGFRLAIGLLVFLMGLLMMISSVFFFKQQKNSGQHYIGLFFALLSFWIIAESRMLQFITGSQMIIGSLAYISLTLFPIPLAIYLKNYIVQKFKKPYQVIIVAFAIQFIVVYFAQLFGISDFFETVVISQILLMIGFFIAIYTLSYEAIKYQNKPAKIALKFLLIILIFFLFELLNFILGNFIFISLFALTGVGLFVLLIFIGFTRNLIYRWKVSYRAEFLENMAYHDVLTNAKNRRAFEEDFDKIFIDKIKVSKIRLVYFDFDDLKRINDLKGHQEGDQLLKSGFDCINKTFGKHGECYRLGGDEFACIIYDRSASAFENAAKELEVQFKNLTKHLGFSSRISIGSTTFKNEDSKYSDMMKRADEDMYRNKRDHKIVCS